MSDARPKKHPRVQTGPVRGSDPTPQLGVVPVVAAEDDPVHWGDGAGPTDASVSPVIQPRAPKHRADVGPNDAQLLRDVPPHWG